jgi:hypothetical protein
MVDVPLFTPVAYTTTVTHTVDPAAAAAAAAALSLVVLLLPVLLLWYVPYWCNV